MMGRLFRAFFLRRSYARVLKRYRFRQLGVFASFWLAESDRSPILYVYLMFDERNRVFIRHSLRRSVSFSSPEELELAIIYQRLRPIEESQT